MKYLTTLGYNEYKQPSEQFYTHKTLWQKKVESASVCDSNNALYIDVMEYQFDFCPMQYTVGITAEKDGIWYKLEAYSLSSEDLEEKLAYIQSNLIKMFNLL